MKTTVPTTNELIQRAQNPADEEGANGTIGVKLDKSCEAILKRLRKRKPDENGKVGRMQNLGEVATELILWAHQELEKAKTQSPKAKT